MWAAAGRAGRGRAQTQLPNRRAPLGVQLGSGGPGPPLAAGSLQGPPWGTRCSLSCLRGARGRIMGTAGPRAPAPLGEQPLLVAQRAASSAPQRAGAHLPPGTQGPGVQVRARRRRPPLAVIELQRCRASSGALCARCQLQLPLRVPAAAGLTLPVPRGRAAGGQQQPGAQGPHPQHSARGCADSGSWGAPESRNDLQPHVRMRHLLCARAVSHQEPGPGRDSVRGRPGRQPQQDDSALLPPPSLPGHPPSRHIWSPCLPRPGGWGAAQAGWPAVPHISSAPGPSWPHPLSLSAHLCCTSGQDHCLVLTPFPPTTTSPVGAPGRRRPLARAPGTARAPMASPAWAPEGALWLPGLPLTYLRGSGRTRAGRRRGASRGRPAPRARAQGRWGAWRPPSPGRR